MLERILRELSHNDTTLVGDSFFRVTLENYLLPLLSKEPNSFDRCHDIIDELEPLKNDAEALRTKLKSILEGLE